MPPTTTAPPILEETKVRVIFRGFFLSRINQDSQPAMIGAIDPRLPSPPGTPADEPPLACHQPVIQVIGMNNKGVVISAQSILADPDKDFSLVVFDAQQMALPNVISRFQKDYSPDFNRLDRESDKRDFRWFVNYDKVHKLPSGTKVDVDETKLRPQFTMNRGVFHTSDLSDGEMRLAKAIPATDRGTLLGRVAMEITSRIQLDPGHTAVFRKGTTEPPIFTIASDTEPDNTKVDRYEIVFDCQCRRKEDEPDFDLIYRYLLVKNVDESHQVQLPPDRAPLLAERSSVRISPEVYCMGGGYGGG